MLEVHPIHFTIACVASATRGHIPYLAISLQLTSATMVAGLVGSPTGGHPNHANDTTYQCALIYVMYSSNISSYRHATPTLSHVLGTSGDYYKLRLSKGGVSFYQSGECAVGELGSLWGTQIGSGGHGFPVNLEKSGLGQGYKTKLRLSHGGGLSEGWINFTDTNSITAQAVPIDAFTKEGASLSVQFHLKSWHWRPYSSQWLSTILQTTKGVKSCMVFFLQYCSV